MSKLIWVNGHFRKKRRRKKLTKKEQKIVGFLALCIIAASMLGWSDNDKKKPSMEGTTGSTINSAAPKDAK